MNESLMELLKSFEEMVTVCQQTKASCTEEKAENLLKRFLTDSTTLCQLNNVHEANQRQQFFQIFNAFQQYLLACSHSDNACKIRADKFYYEVYQGPLNHLLLTEQIDFFLDGASQYLQQGYYEDALPFVTRALNLAGYSEEQNSQSIFPDLSNQLQRTIHLLTVLEISYRCYIFLEELKKNLSTLQIGNKIKQPQVIITIWGSLQPVVQDVLALTIDDHGYLLTQWQATLHPYLDSYRDSLIEQLNGVLQNQMDDIPAITAAVKPLLELAKNTRKFCHYSFAENCLYQLNEKLIQYNKNIRDKNRALSTNHLLEFNDPNIDTELALIRKKAYLFQKQQPVLPKLASPCLWTEHRQQLKNLRDALQKKLTLVEKENKADLGTIITAHHEYTQGIKKLIAQALQFHVEFLQKLRPIPCTQFTVLGLGSLSRGFMGTYSDLEVAFLAENHTPETPSYILSVLRLLNFYLNSLGDRWCWREEDNHPSPKDWLGLHIDKKDIETLEKIHTSGLSGDNDSPLLNTPEQLADWIVRQWHQSIELEKNKINPDKIGHLSEHKQYAYQLMSVTNLFSTQTECSQKLSNRFHARLKEHIKTVAKLQSTEEQNGHLTSPSLLSYSQISNFYLTEFNENFRTATKYHAKSQLVDIKQRYLAPLLAWCVNLGMYAGILDASNQRLETDPIKILNQLELAQIFPQAWIELMQLALREVIRLRSKAQFLRQCQPDKLPKPKNKYTAQKQYDEKYLTASELAPHVLSESEYQQLQFIDKCVLKPAYQYAEKLVANIQLEKNNQLNQKTHINSDLPSLTLTRLSTPTFFFWQSILELWQHDQVNKTRKRIALLITGLVTQQVNIQIYQEYYRVLSQEFSGQNVESLREYFLAQLQQQMVVRDNDNNASKNQYKVNLNHLLASLADIPNFYGYRQSERIAYQRLHEELIAITEEKAKPSAAFPQITLCWPDLSGHLIERTVQEKFITSLIELATGQLRRKHTNSQHAVTDLLNENHALYFKALPDQPMMDYAIDLLHRRLIGYGTPANVLVRCTVTFANSADKISYPVLVSQALGKMNLQKALKKNKELKIDHAYYTELVLVALLTGSGDGASRNHSLIQTPEKLLLACVDNEQQFVEPIIKEMRWAKLNKVQYRNILFCLNQANTPLDKTILTKFLQGNNPYNLISQFIRDISAREQAYLKLYPSEVERKQLYTLDNKHRFCARLLLHPGVIGQLLIQLNYLQIYVNLPSTIQALPSALDLLAQLNPRLGHYYRQAFNKSSCPEKRFQLATDAPHASLSSSLAIKATLGLVPTFEETENQDSYSLQAAEKELHALLEFKPDFSKLVDSTGKPDINRQQLMLKAIGLYPHEQLSLSHCVVLNDVSIQWALAKSTQLQELDIRACPHLTNKSINYLATQHSTLKKLYLSDNSGIKAIQADNLFFNNKALSLYWPHLQVLHVSRCKNLTSVHIHAPKLIKFKDKQCPQLQKKLINAPQLIINKQTIENIVLPNDIVQVEPGVLYFKMIAVGIDYEKRDYIASYVHGYYINKNITIFADFHAKNISISQQNFRVGIIDTEMGDSYRAGIRLYYRDVLGTLLFASTASYKDFIDSLKRRIGEIRTNAGQKPIILLGMDIEKRKVSYEQALALAKDYEVSAYFECSAKTGERLKEAFEGAFEIAVAYSGLWERLGKNYIPSASVMRGLLQPLPTSQTTHESDNNNTSEMHTTALFPPSNMPLHRKSLIFSETPIAQASGQLLSEAGFFATSSLTESEQSVTSSSQAESEKIASGISCEKMDGMTNHIYCKRTV